MDEWMKELVAVGASVSAHCQPCLAWHLGRARELGVAEQDILAAIEVGLMVERGAGNAMRKYAAELVRQPQAQSTPCCSGEAPTAKCCS